jgi:hypothetical protein
LCVVAALVRVANHFVGRRRACRLLAFHRHSERATTTSRSCPATASVPAALTPDPRIARGAGQRDDPAEGPERCFDPVRLSVSPARDQRRPVSVCREILDRWRCDLERVGEAGASRRTSGRRSRTPGISSFPMVTANRKRAACHTTITG